jgi:hypothetical protein
MDARRRMEEGAHDFQKTSDRREARRRANEHGCGWGFGRMDAVSTNFEKRLECGQAQTLGEVVGKLWAI